MAPDCSGNTTGLAFEATQEFLITYFLTFVWVILFVVPLKVQFAHISWTLFQLHILTGIFVQFFHVGNIILRLYWAARECRHFQVPVPKTQDYKHVKDRQ